MVGGKEILRVVSENLPQSMQDMAVEKAVDLSRGSGYINKEIAEVFAEQERQSERDLWENIRTQYMRGGLGAVGVEDVLATAKAGRVEKAIVERGYKPKGMRCRECENLSIERTDACSACGSSSLYEVDLINEIAEMLKQTGAEVDFADRIDTLAEAGGVAALLRY
jgi:peptide subunit release factor 1 (eRF1)